VLRKKFVSGAARFLLGLATLIGAAEQSRAALYVGNLDPLHWLGTATFNISDQCIGFSLVSSAPGCTATLVSTAITIKDLNLNVLGIVDFGPGPGGDVVAFDWQGSGLPLLDVGNAAFFYYPASLTTPNGTLALRLRFDVGNGSPQTGTATLQQGFCNEGCSWEPYLGDGPAIQLGYTRIPEPGLIGLLLGAATAACFFGRRRQRTN